MPIPTSISLSYVGVDIIEDVLPKERRVVELNTYYYIFRGKFCLTRNQGPIVRQVFLLGSQVVPGSLRRLRVAPLPSRGNH